MAEEFDHAGDVVGDGTAAQGTQLGDAGLDLIHGGVLGGARGVVPGVVGEHIGLDATGRDGIDGDALRAGVGGEGTREGLHGRLGTGV